MSESESGTPDPSASPGETNHKNNVPIVGIGASAGGLDALRRLLQNLHTNSGMGLVIVQHLDPMHESALAEILSRNCTLPVTQIEHDSAVDADHVYVIPPNASLSIADGRLSLATLGGTRVHPNVIDEFFISLAHDRGERAACVILSGTGSDGTLGLRAVKENGGLTVAQADAEYDGMMRSAVATGLVDFMLRPEEIPASLVAYFQEAWRAPDETDWSKPGPRPRASWSKSRRCCGRGPDMISATTRNVRSSAACAAACTCCRSTTSMRSSRACAAMPAKSVCCFRTC